MNLSRVWRDALSVLVLLALLIAGESLALGGVRLVVIPLVTAAFPGRSGASLFVIECVVAAIAIFAVGCVFGLISVLVNRRKELSKGWLARWLERHGWSREQWLAKALKRGEPLGFVAGSLLGGGWGIGWWYARKRHPHPFVLAFVGAAVLAPPSAVGWVAAFNPLYTRYDGLVVAAVMLVLAVPVTTVARRISSARRHAVR